MFSFFFITDSFHLVMINHFHTSLYTEIKTVNIFHVSNKTFRFSVNGKIQAVFLLESG